MISILGIIKKILNLKLVTKLEYQNMKIFLQRVSFQIGLKKFLLLKKLKILFHGHMLLVILLKKMWKYFMKNNCKKQIKSLVLKK